MIGMMKKRPGPLRARNFPKPAKARNDDGNQCRKGTALSHFDRLMIQAPEFDYRRSFHLNRNCMIRIHKNIFTIGLFLGSYTRTTARFQNWGPDALRVSTDSDALISMSWEVMTIRFGPRARIT